MTHEEAPRFGAAVIPSAEFGPGYVGQLAKGPDGACVYYDRKRGCSVYHKRPAVCVKWQAIPPECGYRPDPLKQLGLERLSDHRDLDDWRIARHDQNRHDDGEH